MGRVCRSPKNRPPGDRHTGPYRVSGEGLDGAKQLSPISQNLKSSQLPGKQDRVTHLTFSVGHKDQQITVTHISASPTPKYL